MSIVTTDSGKLRLLRLHFLQSVRVQYYWLLPHHQRIDNDDKFKQLETQYKDLFLFCLHVNIYRQGRKKAPSGRNYNCDKVDKTEQGHLSNLCSQSLLRILPCLFMSEYVTKFNIHTEHIHIMYYMNIGHNSKVSK